MVKQVYVDTNIIIDYLTERKQSSFLKRALECEFTLYISNFTIRELKNNGFDASTLIQWLSFAEKCTITTITHEDKRRAHTLPTHYADALHAACAIRLGVDFLITRNIKDFKRLPLVVKHPDFI